MLIKLGADIEAKDPNWGNTPLRWCCWWGVPDVARVLMEAGAEASSASALAESSKTNNTFTKRPPKDFDRTVKIIEDHLASGSYSECEQLPRDRCHTVNTNDFQRYMK